MMPSSGERGDRMRSQVLEAPKNVKPRAKSARGGSGRGRPELRALQSLRTIFGSARAHDAEVRRSSGLSGSKLWALSEIAARRGITVNELANQMALHQTTASNLVNALVEQRLICRVRDARDKRVIHLHQSVEGQKVLRETPAPHAGLLVDALRRLETGQIERLRESLVLLVSVMQEAAADSAGDPLMGE
jgi:DNA-binding MarR family transcriptional regulator